MSQLRPLINRQGEEVRVVAFMSGTGTNLLKILEHQNKIYSETNRFLYKIVGILTDNPLSNAQKISAEFNIPLEVNDINDFYKRKGLPRSDLSIREEFDSTSLNLIEKFQPDMIVLAGYMSILTKVIIDRFPTINVHPADLSIKHPDGSRKYIGAHAVRDAILAGEKYIRSSTHVVEEKVDNGRLLMISQGIEVILPHGFDPSNKHLLKQVEEINQRRLKEFGDWKILPLTIEYISLGYFEKDEKSNIYFKGKPVPNGVRLD
ncbi:MAG: formyltransferase family protein [Deltaproteobacteria bacterium]|nr:formyltransferase family protein [Deltaproteobacteria bacterium]